MTPTSSSKDLVKKAPISVLVLHRYRIVTDDLGSVLQDRPEFSLAGVATEPGRALAALEQIDAVDVLVFDILSCYSPTRFVRELRTRWSDTKILPMNVVPQKEVVDLIEAGACGYVPATAGFDELLRVIGQVHANRAPSCPLVVAAVLDRLKELSMEDPQVEPANAGTRRLTEKEVQVLQLLAEGCTNRDLSRRLGVAMSTAKMHVRSILAKLHVERRQDAVRVAAELGLLKPRSLTLHRPA